MSSANGLFLCIAFLGPLVAVSSTNWMVCWIGVELSFIGLIPLLFFGGGYFSLNKESTMKYFCIQAFGSALLFLGGLAVFSPAGDTVSEDGVTFSYFMFWSLVVKLGGFPAHFWVLSVVSGLDWFPMALLLTWQKVSPFLLLINLLENEDWLCSSALIVGGVSSLIGSLIGLNQTNFRSVLGASSISHTGWGMIASVFGSFWLYFGVYCFSFLMLAIFLKLKKSLMSGVLMLSLSGLPPFLLFVGKWKVLLGALSSGCSILYLLLPLLGSFISLFFYLKFLYSFYLEEEYYNFPSGPIFLMPFVVLNVVGSYYLVTC